jgi:hypothetical protein
MDADVMITIAFCLEVFLFGLIAATFISLEARGGRTEAGPARANVSAPKTGPRATAHTTAQWEERSRDRRPTCPQLGR